VSDKTNIAWTDSSTHKDDRRTERPPSPPAAGSANRPRIIVRWESPRNGCLREETCPTMKQARDRRDELARGHIVSEIWETVVPHEKGQR
jgi:hypothetical protein